MKEQGVNIEPMVIMSNKNASVLNPDVSPIFIGYVTKATFGNADGTMYLHIVGNDEVNQQVVEGNAPFSVQLKIDGNVVRTINDIPVCVNYTYANIIPALGPICEMNCIISNLPAGAYDVVITDALGINAFGMQHVYEIQPPYATLNGTVDPNGVDTTVWFDFGLTTDYDRTAEFGIVNGFVPVNCSLRLQSQSSSGNPIEYLEEGKTYHFRIRATNQYGDAFGDDVTFNTPSYLSAPVVVTLPATNIV